MNLQLATHHLSQVGISITPDRSRQDSARTCKLLRVGKMILIKIFICLSTDGHGRIRNITFHQFP